MADDVYEVVQVEAELEALSSPTSSDVWREMHGRSAEAVAAIAAKLALEGASSGGPPSGAAGGVLGGTYPNPGFAADMATQAELDAVASAAVAKALYDANTVLAADSDNTPAAVTMGASTILARLAAGNIKAASVAEIATLLAPSLGGYEFDYAQNATDATSTQTVQASATTIITGASVTYDGATSVMIQFAALLGNNGGGTTIIDLWEDSTNVKRMAQTVATATPVSMAFRRIPTAGAKVYTIRMYVTANTGTCFGATAAPSMLRITRA